MVRFRSRSIWRIAGGALTIALAAAGPRASAQPAGEDASAAGASRGKTVYDAHCVSCHGVGGKGDGPAASMLVFKPQDLTTGKYKLRSTESGSVPTDEDLLRSVRDGLHGTAMPGWAAVLSDADMRAAVDYIKTFSPRFATEPPRLVALAPEVPTSPESIVAGRRIYDKLECGTCHGTDGRASGATVAELHDDWGRDMVAADLTEPWAFRGGARPRDIYVRLKSGMDGTPMPSYAQSADDGELWDLANYVVSLGRKPAWQMSADEIRALYTQRDADAKANPVKWGSYLIYRQGCLFCHTPIREDGSLVEELRLAGGQLWRVGAYGDFVSYNLTSDEETGIGRRTDGEIKRVITTGIRHDGTRMLPLLMPWHAYAHLRPIDLDAIVAYLRTLPPVRNHIPPPQPTDIVTYMWRKFRVLILREDLPLVTYPGNAGRLEEGQLG